MVTSFLAVSLSLSFALAIYLWFFLSPSLPHPLPLSLSSKLYRTLSLFRILCRELGFLKVVFPPLLQNKPENLILVGLPFNQIINHVMRNP